jgi:predicted nucleic acid-binding protein
MVCAYDRGEPRKQARAQELLKHGLEEDSVVLSVQVLGEFFVTVTRKIRNPMTKDKTIAMVAAVGCCALFASQSHLAAQAAPPARHRRTSAVRGSPSRHPLRTPQPQKPRTPARN